MEGVFFLSFSSVYEFKFGRDVFCCEGFEIVLYLFGEEVCVRGIRRGVNVVIRGWLSCWLFLLGVR